MRNFYSVFLFVYSAFAFGETVIPIEIQYGNPIATAVIDDQELRLIVDSGGYSLGLRPEVVKSLDIDQTEKKTSTTDVHGSTRESWSFRISSLEFGGHKFSDLSAYEWDIPEPLAQRIPAIDGTLGRDFLNQYVAVYDYGNAKITLYDRREQLADSCTGVEVPLIEHPEQIIATEIEVDHGNLRAIWDTGATHSFLKAHVAEMQKIPLETDEDTAGFYNSDTFGLGGSDFGPLDFVTLPYIEPKNIDVFIGRNVFARHVICVNAPDGWLRIRPN